MIFYCCWSRHCLFSGEWLRLVLLSFWFNRLFNTSRPPVPTAVSFWLTGSPFQAEKALRWLRRAPTRQSGLEGSTGGFGGSSPLSSPWKPPGAPPNNCATGTGQPTPSHTHPTSRIIMFRNSIRFQNKSSGLEIKFDDRFMPLNAMAHWPSDTLEHSFTSSVAH